MRDAVGLVIELIRVQPDKVVEQIVDQNVRMQLRDAVDTVGTDDCQRSHVDLIVFQDRDAVSHVALIRELLRDFL